MRAQTLQRLLRHEVELRRVGALDQFGQPVLGEPVVLRARVQRRQLRSVNESGEEFISRMQVMVAIESQDAISVGDQLSVFGTTQPVRALIITEGVRGTGVVVCEARL